MVEADTGAIGKLAFVVTAERIASIVGRVALMASCRAATASGQLSIEPEWIVARTARTPLRRRSAADGHLM
jgi:hypothetical protein